MARKLKQWRGEKGGKAGGGSSRTAREAPNTLQSNTVAKVVDILSEGEIEGLVNGDKSIFFDATPLQNPSDDSYNFNGIIVETRMGTPDQEYLTGFQSVETEVAVGVKVIQSTPIIRTISDAETDAIRLKIRTPALTQQDTSNGDLNGTSVQFKIEVQPDGGSYTLADIGAPNPYTLSGKTTSPYEVDFRVPLPAGGDPWNVKVTRITPDSGSVALVNEIYWSSYTKLIDNKLTYPDVALIGLRVDAQQFNQTIPSRAYEIKGIKVKVPSNYNPITREYTGLWDGTFDIAWTDNPAWILYDLMTNERYGLGDVLKEELIDKYSFYSIAQYNDELVPDGYGGMEPRFRFNGVLQTREEAYDVLSSVASCMNCQTYWSAGIVMISQDRPSDPVKLVSPANVIGGEFTYSGTALKARNSVVAVQWNDPDDFYQPAVTLVEDADMIDQVGWRQKDVAAYGCTSRGQAYRFGKWIIDTERHSTEILSYKASMDHVDVKPGDIIAVADPDYAGIRYGGRLVSGTTTSATLDAPIDISDTEEYEIAIMLDNGQIEERVVTNVAGTHTTLTWDSALSLTPSAGAMWVITGTNVAPRQFRVVGVSETEANIFEINAIYHDPTKYDRIEQDFNLASPNFTILPSGPIRTPSGVSVSEYVYQAGARVKSAVTLSWTAAADPRVAFYQVEIKRPGTDYFAGIGATSGVSIDIPDTPNGVYSFRVRAVDNLGRFSEYATLNTSLLGLLAPPSDVSVFQINTNGDLSFLSWTAVPDLDVSHYTIKYYPITSGATWNNATVIVPRVSRDTTSVTVPSRVGTYLIKAFDQSGVESVNATMVVTANSLLAQTNAVVTITEDPSWSGTMTATVNDTGILKLDEGEIYGIYEFDNIIDLEAVFVSRVIPNIVASGETRADTMDSWDSLSSVDALSSADASSWGVRVQVSTTLDDPTGTPTWSAWSDLIVAEYEAWGLKFRLVLTSLSTNITPAVTAASITVDMPDRIERGNDVTSSTLGTAITYASNFKAIPAVNITAQDLVQGDYWVINSSTVGGFNITFKNISNTAVVRSFDWTAVGYGNESP